MASSVVADHPQAVQTEPTEETERILQRTTRREAVGPHEWDAVTSRVVDNQVDIAYESPSCGHTTSIAPDPTLPGQAVSSAGSRYGG